MSTKDLSPGDLLYKILYPRSNEVRIKETEKEVSRLKKYSRQSRDSNTETDNAHGESEGSSNVPQVDITTITATTTNVFTGDGIYRPSMVIAVPAQWRDIRGFMRYQVRVSKGGQGYEEFDGPSIIDGDPGSVIITHFPNSGTAGNITYRIRIVSNLYGPGPWSDEGSFTQATDGTAPGNPAGVSSTAIPGGATVTWTAPTEPDYEHTEVWVGNSGVNVKLVGTTSKNYFELFWDFTAYSAHNQIFVAHVDRSKNRSGFVATTANKAGIDGPQLAATISYGGVITITGSGKVTGGNTSLTSTGIKVAGATGGSNTFDFYDETNPTPVLVGSMWSQGVSGSNTAAVHLNTVANGTTLNLYGNYAARLTSSGQVYIAGATNQIDNALTINGATTLNNTLNQIINDGALTTTTDFMSIDHNSTGTPGVNFGTGIKFRLESSTTADQDAAKISVIWTTATHGTRQSAISFFGVTAGGSLTELMRYRGDGRLSLGHAGSPTATLHIIAPATTTPALLAVGGTAITSLNYVARFQHGSGSTSTAPTIWATPISVNAPGVKVTAPASYTAYFIECLDSNNTDIFVVNSNGAGIGAPGEITNPNTYMDLGASTSSKGSFFMTPGATMTSNIGAGIHWFDSTQHTDMMGASTGLALALPGVLFTTTDDKQVVNTSSETTLINTIVGNKVVKASTWAVGKTLRIKIWGIISTDASTQNLNIKIKLGTTVVATTGVVGFRGGMSGRLWELAVDITCRTLGASGTVISQGFVQNTQATGQTAWDVYEMTLGTTTTTLDTTVDKTIDVTATWTTAHTSNSITSTNVEAEFLN